VSVKYARVPWDNPFFAAISMFFDTHGGGNSDLRSMRSIVPNLQTVKEWMERSGRQRLEGRG
jgi:hypothetical protein